MQWRSSCGRQLHWLGTRARKHFFIPNARFGLRGLVSANSMSVMSSRTRATCSLGFECLEARQMLAGDLVISEFVASNDNGIRDEDHNRPDWIGVLNTGDTEIDLDGWFLTDDVDDLD